MRIKRFAGAPLLRAGEKNKRTLVLLAKTEPRNSITAVFVPIKPRDIKLY